MPTPTTLLTTSRPHSPRRGVRELSDEDIQAIAQRLAELLEHETPSTPRLLTAAEVARRYNTSRTWVYEHANQLGAITLGNGPKPRLKVRPRPSRRRTGARAKVRTP